MERTAELGFRWKDLKLPQIPLEVQLMPPLQPRSVRLYVECEFCNSKCVVAKHAKYSNRAEKNPKLALVLVPKPMQGEGTKTKRRDIE
jgi:hypothetical protein